MAYNPKLKINLLDVFNRNYASKPYEVRKALRQRVMSDAFKGEFGARCVELIIERTLKGKDKDGDRFVKYSKAYKQSLEFQLYKEGTRVDLKLSGGMLAAMMSEYNSNMITIKFDDSDEAAKAHGHINGSNHLPVRDFFGISDKEADKILKGLVKSGGEDDAALIDQALEDI